jgi:hypothetical protein
VLECTRIRRLRRTKAASNKYSHCHVIIRVRHTETSDKGQVSRSEEHSNPFFSLAELPGTSL